MLGLIVALECMVGTARPVESVHDLAVLHAAAVDRWETIDATFQMTETWQNAKYSIRYRKARGRIRCDEQSSLVTGVVQTAIVHQGRLVTVATGPNLGNGSVTIQAGRDANFLGNPSLQLMLGFDYADRLIPLAELIVQKSNSTKISQINDDGRELIKLELSMPVPGKSDNRDYVFYFDPSLNYLARRYVVQVNGRDQDRGEQEVLEFREVFPGVYFPVRSKTIGYQNGKKIGTVNYEMTELKINEPIDDRVFDVAIPIGAQVFDRISGKEYEAGPRGQPSGPVEQISSLPLVGATVISPNQAEPTPYREKIASDNSLASYYVGGGVVAALLAVFLYYRKQTTRFAS